MRTRLSVLICTAAAVVTLTAQTSPPARDSQETPPTFRSGANLIRVDMYATRDGQRVTDLRPEEIELYEDGVRQKIETFEYVKVDGGASLTGAAATEDSRTRIFVVFVDTHTAQLTGDGELRQALLRFLDRTVQGADLVGLMTPDMSALDVTLGRKAKVVSDVANDERWMRKPSADKADPKDFLWENCYSTGRRVSRRVTEMKARRDGKETIDALRDLVDRLRELREERKAVLLVTGGWPFSDDTVLLNGSDNETKVCADDRKALMKLNYNNLLRDLARTANRANVSFYPVNTRRQVTLSREIPVAVRNQMQQREQRTQDTISDQLGDLASSTDGLAELRLREMDKVTDRIIADTSAYYLVGYESTNQRTDSRYRSITVKTTRPGVVIRSRPGYGGENVRVIKLAAEPTASKPIMDSRVTAAFTNVQRFEAASPVWLRTSTFTSSAPSESGGSFWVVGERGSRGERWGSGTAEVIVTTPDKKQVFSQTFDVTPQMEEFNIRVPASGTLPLGSYAVRLRMNGAGEGNAAVHDLPRVDLVSTLTGLGEAVFWRRGPAVRDEYQRTADPRFRRNERMRLEFETDMGEAPSARLLDRMGRPLPVPIQLNERAEKGGRWVMAELPLLALAPGDYAVEMTQRDRSRITAFQLVP